MMSISIEANCSKQEYRIIEQANEMGSNYNNFNNIRVCISNSNVGLSQRSKWVYSRRMAILFYNVLYKMGTLR